MKMPTNKNLRDAISNSLDALEKLSFNDGFEAAANALDELSEIKHNQNDHETAGVLRWAASELRGDNA
jgi:protein-arginine kinase activator protein McsA